MLSFAVLTMVQVYIAGSKFSFLISKRAENPPGFFKISLLWLSLVILIICFESFDAFLISTPEDLYEILIFFPYNYVFFVIIIS